MLWFLLVVSGGAFEGAIQQFSLVLIEKRWAGREAYPEEG
jgi:hypothetical protein